MRMRGRVLGVTGYNYNAYNKKDIAKMEIISVINRGILKSFNKSPRT